MVVLFLTMGGRLRGGPVPEAKKLVAMQTTLYEIRDRIHRGEIHAFSSNPVLYRDMSRRGD